MNKIVNKYILIGLVYLMVISVLAFQFTHSFFSSGANSTANVFATANVFPTIQPSVTPTATPSATPTPTPTGIANHVVISEVQITGGTGLANDNDFIELYNPTSSQINLNGFRLVKRSGNSSSDVNVVTFSSSNVIPAQGFYLWAHKASNNNYADVIHADVSSSDTLAASNSIAIRQGALDTGIIIDALSWDPGATSLKEGAQFESNPGPNQSIERKAYSSSTASTMAVGGVDEFKGNGYDTNNNANDFILRLVSQPQNSTSPTETP